MAPDIAHYFSEFKKISKKKNSSHKKIKIALLSSFTTKGLKEVLAVRCFELGITADIYEAQYNQYNQEILDPKSGLYTFKPDLVILYVDYQSIAGDLFFSPYSVSKKARKDFCKEKCAEFSNLIDTLKSHLSSKIVLHNFMVPAYSPLGILEQRQEYGHFEMVRELNQKIADTYKNESQVFVFDYDRFCSSHGKANIVDSRMYYIGDIKLKFDLMPELADEYISYIRPMLTMNKKCIVLDLDNTLWGGILGEDGINGIQLGPTPEGRPFLEFQKHLLSLFSKGTILAINSKNNEKDVLEALSKHPDMILKEKHFASIKANWNDKATNIAAISKEINIGLYDMVFFDDDALNRELVAQTHPEVYVVAMPADPSEYVTVLQQLNLFNTLQLTDEDKKKGEMYAAQRSRQSLQHETKDLTSFLKGLQMKVAIEKANDFTIPRIAQLTQKTNQFNLTTKRYMEEDIKKFSKSKDHLVVSIRAEDKFGDNGIVGVAIAVKKKTWEIDTFLMSCRVIGRKIEETLLLYVCEQAHKAGATHITGMYIPSDKNSLVESFYKDNGFSLEKKEKGSETWSFELGSKIVYPSFLSISIQ